MLATFAEMRIEYQKLPLSHHHLWYCSTPLRQRMPVLFQKGGQHPLQCGFIYAGLPAIVFMRAWALDIAQDRAGDELGLMPPLLLQQLRYHPLLGVFQIEL